MKGAITPAGQSTQPSAPGGKHRELLSLQDEKTRLTLLSSPRVSWDQVKARAGISRETRGCKGRLKDGPRKSTVRRKACTLQTHRGAWLPVRAMGQQPQHSSPSFKERPPAHLPWTWHSSWSPLPQVCISKLHHVLHHQLSQLHRKPQNICFFFFSPLLKAAVTKVTQLGENLSLCF